MILILNFQLVSPFGIYLIYFHVTQNYFEKYGLKASFHYTKLPSGGHMVLGHLPVPGRSTKLDRSRARAYCACNREGCLNIFSLIYRFSLLFPSPWETVR